jgi:hypothetical protein
METYFNIIGKNYDTTLKYINDSGKSEYYIPAASDQMPYSELKKNYDALLSQINFFLDKMNGANKKSIENLSKILDIKNSLVADYEKKILAYESQQNTGGNTGNSGDVPVKLPPELLPPVLQDKKAIDKKYLLLIGAAILGFIIITK